MGLAYRILGGDGLGLWSLVAAMIAFLDLGTLGLATALSRYLPLALAENDQRSIAKIVATVSTSLAVLVAWLALFAYFPLSIALVNMVGDEHIAMAHAVLVWSLIGLWTKTLGSCVCHALVGAHRTPEKCKLRIIAWGLRLLATISFLELYGVLALPLGLLIESLFIVLAGWWLLQRALGLSFANLLAVDTKIFTKLAAYGIQLQGASLATLLFDPMTRLVVSWSTGLETLALFDMASRLVTHVRQLVVAAIQVAVPAVASAGQDQPARLKLICDQMIDGAWLGGSLVMAVACLCMPLISALWLGLMDPTFIQLGWYLIIGWWFTLFGVPAYMLAVGLGWTDIILKSQWIMALTGTILILAGNYAGGPSGLTAGIATALIVSTLVLVRLVMQRVGPALSICPIIRCSRLILTVLFLVAFGLSWFPMGTTDVLMAWILASFSLPVLSLTIASQRLRHAILQLFPSAKKAH